MLCRGWRPIGSVKQKAARSLDSGCRISENFPAFAAATMASPDMANIQYRDILVMNVLAVFSGVCARQRYDMFLHKKGCLMGFSSFILFHRRYL